MKKWEEERKKEARKEEEEGQVDVYMEVYTQNPNSPT